MSTVPAQRASIAWDAAVRAAIWVSGFGDLAAVSYCRGEITVTRHATVERAEAAKRRIDKLSCGAQCERRHKVIARVPTIPHGVTQ